MPPIPHSQEAITKYRMALSSYDRELATIELEVCPAPAPRSGGARGPCCVPGLLCTCSVCVCAVGWLHRTLVVLGCHEHELLHGFIFEVR